VEISCLQSDLNNLAEEVTRLQQAAEVADADKATQILCAITAAMQVQPLEEEVNYAQEALNAVEQQLSEEARCLQVSNEEIAKNRSQVHSSNVEVESLQMKVANAALHEERFQSWMGEHVSELLAERNAAAEKQAEASRNLANLRAAKLTLQQAEVQHVDTKRHLELAKTELQSESSHSKVLVDKVMSLEQSLQAMELSQEVSQECLSWEAAHKLADGSEIRLLQAEVESLCSNAACAHELRSSAEESFAEMRQQFACLEQDQICLHRSFHSTS